MTRYVRYQNGSETAFGTVDNDTVTPVAQQTLGELITSGGPGLPAGQAQALSATPLLCPVDRPGKLLCTGVNYASHKDENPAAVLPTVPFFFSKLPSAVIGPEDEILMPESSTQLDYEVELAVIIGRRAKRLSDESALEVVWGYTVLNDVSARDVQFTDNQITLGKGFDGFCPIGPCLVTADEIPNPQDLVVEPYVNGERRQYESTANMLFSVAELLVFLTRHITLNPGDVVSTGTPGGVGIFMNPPGTLHPGDLIEVEVDRIGRLSNRVVADW